MPKVFPHINFSRDYSPYYIYLISVENKKQIFEQINELENK